MMKQQWADDPADAFWAKLIRDERLKLGLTQRQLGEAAGLPHQRIYEIENGKRRHLRPSTLVKILSGLGLELRVVRRNSA